MQHGITCAASFQSLQGYTTATPCWDGGNRSADHQLATYEQLATVVTVKFAPVHIQAAMAEAATAA